MNNYVRERAALQAVVDFLSLTPEQQIEWAPRNAQNPDYVAGVEAAKRLIKVRIKDHEARIMKDGLLAAQLEERRQREYLAEEQGRLLDEAARELGIEKGPR